MGTLLVIAQLPKEGIRNTEASTMPARAIAVHKLHLAGYLHQSQPETKNSPKNIKDDLSYSASLKAK